MPRHVSEESSITRLEPHDAVPFVGVGAYPTRAGNRVVPWIDGEPAFRRICEAIEHAQESVWATITFMWSSFVMPDGRGSALDVLERAAQRGVDVRLLFWRPDEETASLRTNAFWGSEEHFALLQRYPGVNARWDRAQSGYCQHQKSWVIDAGREDAAAFVGSMNLNPHSLATSAHVGARQNHDVCVELRGPSVVDVSHNFVQRWNAASERSRVDGRFGARSDEALAMPERAPSLRGDVMVQVQRTTHAERTNLEQYCAAIGAAERTIYLEHQCLEVDEIVGALCDALARGVHVVALMPVVPERATVANACARLSMYEHFTLCGMVGRDTDGSRTPVHVHAKLMIVDDVWATVGSCNLHRYSLFGNAELNVAFAHEQTVRALRVALFQEHVATDTSLLADVEALQLFRRVAHEYRERHARGDAAWQGLAIALDGSQYGATPLF